MPNVFSNISEIAATLKDTEARLDIDSCKMAILFPLVEALGYDVTRTGDILLNPAYTNDGEYKLDYGLRGENEDSIKTVIKVIAYDAEPGLEFTNIRKAISSISSVEYVLITDCFHYFIYANSMGGMFDEITVFEIDSISNDELRMLSLLANPSVSTRQDFVIDRNNEMDQNNTELDVNSETDDLIPFEEENSPKNKNGGKKPPVMAIMIGTLCVLMLGTSALLAFHERNNPDNWYSISFPHDDQELNVHALKGTVKASAYKDKLHAIQFGISDSNLPSGINVTITLKNMVRNESISVGYLTDTTGCVNTEIAIPESWVDCNIGVKAEILFDENQTPIASEYYGTSGIRIIQLGDKDKSTIDETEFFYNSTQITQTIKENEAIAEANRLQEIRNYFAKFTIVEYSNGDICFYPKGYDTNDWPTDSDATNNNINATDKAYAKIYYDKSTNSATFYYIAGTLMQQASWASGSFVISDTVNTYSIPISSGKFYYHMNTYTSITGWCVYEENGVANLRSMLKTVYSSNRATIEFKGLNQKVNISAKDKAAVTSILDLYDKYFASGDIKLDPDWF